MCVLISLIGLPLLIAAVSIDDPAVFANAPISIQVVGRTLEEEAVLALGKIVDKAVKALSTKATGKM